MKDRKIEVDGVVIREGHIKCLWHGTPGFGELDIYSNLEDPFIIVIHSSGRRCSCEGH